MHRVSCKWKHFNRASSTTQRGLLTLKSKSKKILFISCNTMNTKSDGILLQDVVKRLQSFASIKLAENWDNVGLLTEPSGCHKVKNILLTNDLTQAVMKESIEKSINLIISYHPPIFVPLKRLSQGNWKERLITLSIENRIAIYSPHTAYDAVKGGVNDWLLSCFGAGSSYPICQTFDSEISIEKPNGCYRMCFEYHGQTGDVICLRQKLESSKATVKVDILSIDTRNTLEVYVMPSDKCLADVYDMVKQSNLDISKSEIIKMDKFPLLGYGMGRILHLDASITIEDVIHVVKKHLEIPNVRLALARKASLQKKISSIAVCAGSGGSVLKGVDADVYLTGEMSHHEVLHATESGRTVILCEHSNTERGFLKTLVPTITNWFDGELEVMMSQMDKDPLIMI